MKPPLIRSLQDSDYSDLPRTLNAAFSNYRDAIRYRLSTLAFFREWMWSEGICMALATDHELCGALLSGWRDTVLADQHLKVLHIGPVGVLPRLRRRGFGTEMLREATLQAKAQGADALTLTTEASYGAHRLYRRAGFDVVETFRPMVQILHPMEAHQKPPQDMEMCEPKPWPNPTPRTPNDWVETGPKPPPIPSQLRPREVRLSGGRAICIQWPVISRHGDREELVHSTQVIYWEGGEEPNRLWKATASMAAQDRSVCLYALPGCMDATAAMETKGAPLVYRMARGLSELGKQALTQATSYRELGPAP